MQESLYNTVQNYTKEQKVNVEELEALLDSDIEQVVDLCKKACLKPKTDSMGNAYFTKDEVNMLKKVKELYSKSVTVEENTQDDFSYIEEKLTSPNKKINFLQKAKNRNQISENLNANDSKTMINTRIDALENNIITKMSEILSEKMDGFDEIIVELIRAKTENENLRSQVNNLNKEVFSLKNQLSTYAPLALGLYIKKEDNQL